jgi:hypothetical protein
MKKKPQIFVIHGGMTFKNRKDYLHYLKTRKIRLAKKYPGKKSILTSSLERILR